MIAFCSFWYASYTGQNFAAIWLFIVMFLARISARSPCRSPRTACRTSSMLVVDADAGRGCWVAAQVMAERPNRQTAAEIARVLRTVQPPESDARRVDTRPVL